MSSDRYTDNAPGSRLRYTPEDVTALKEYVDNNPGHPTSLAYWIAAYNYGMTKHTWESMRNKWKSIMESKFIIKARSIIPKNRIKPVFKVIYPNEAETDKEILPATLVVKPITRKRSLVRPIAR